MLELRTTGHCGNCSFGPWMSDNNIDGGARWNDKIAKALEETDFGIVCVTRENQSSAWLNFEAGAVAKKVGQARVIPLLIDLRLLISRVRFRHSNGACSTRRT
jgi:hypothetical protein